MTAHAYDVIERYRDLGGRLIFLSANNFFWKVDERGGVLRRVKFGATWAGRRRALLGVQYRANDDGSSRASTT